MIAGGDRELTRLPLALRALARAEAALSRLEQAGRRRRKRRRGEPLQVLVHLDWRLGDEVIALPVFEALARDAMTRGPLRIAARVRHPELLAGNPFVSTVNPLALCPDLEIELKGEVAGEARRVTLARLAGVDLGGLVPRVHLDEHELRTPGFPELARLPRPRVALHAGTSQACKSWGRARWASLARSLAEEGVSVVEVGLGREPLGVGLDLLGRTGVRALARTLAHVDLVVGDDSGPLHLALAVGTRAVGVFGSTDPALLYPERAPLRAVVTDSACRFCWPRRVLAYPTGNCPLPRHECMDAIAPGLMLREVLAALARPVGAAT